KFERIYGESKDFGIEDNSDLGQLCDELSFYVGVEYAVAIEDDSEKRAKDNEYRQKAGGNERVPARKVSAPAGSFTRFLRRPCLPVFPWFAVVFRHCLVVFGVALKTYR